MTEIVEQDLELLPARTLQSSVAFETSPDGVYVDIATNGDASLMGVEFE